jgi:2-polyprenyl-3-methyl-5-hydroxy-6-metoxy-1,4-benzoquinol methylase
MSEQSADLRAEERDEAEKHDELYRQPEFARLGMKESHWSRFDRTEEILDPYVGSMARLGRVDGLRVLDAGCGDGWLSVILAKRGAFVEGFDISEEGIRVARQRAEVNGVTHMCRFAVGSFYEIPLSNASVDAVIGQSILHHLGHKARAAEELHRVMKPGSRAVFAEPFGNALWLESVRRYVPVKSAAPEDPGEWARQFKYADVEPFRALFDVELQEFQLLSRLERVVSWPPFVRAVGRLDRWLLNQIRWLRPYSRAIVIELRRRAA